MSGDTLQNTDPGKKEIAKDVSATANSGCGLIIYGIKEFDSDDKKHLQEKITPIPVPAACPVGVPHNL